jgi:predicted nuclease of predicted toxin-antitoxin system
MKLLLDQNISHKVVTQLRQHFQYIHSIREFGLTDAMDFKIWEYARLNDFTVVTFDEDFYKIQLIMGFPPKIIWFKTGNISKQQFTDFMIAQKEMILTFLNDENYANEGCLELYLIRK